MMRKEQFVGFWVSALPFDSDDYLIEYSIAMRGQSFKISAKDLQDGEKLRISDIHFDGSSLQFISYVPSTRRRGVNRFTLKGKDRIKSQFTFTVVEDLKKISSSERKQESTKRAAGKCRLSLQKK